MRALVLVLALTTGVGLACNVEHTVPKGRAPAPSGSKAISPIWVGPAHSGSWYAAERNGEGFTLQVLENGTAHALWFTYPPAGATGQQAWIYASGGRIEGDRVRFDGAFTTRGPRFGSGFDPAAVQVIPWGSLEFRFTSCNEAEMSYAGPAAWGSGSRRLTRLTSLSELECTGKRHLTASGARAAAGLRARSGSWFDPAHNGEGWQVEELPDGRSQVYWFTYDGNGEQAWTVGVSPTSGTRMTIAQAFRPVGARFGAAFDPAQVQAVTWGSLELELTSCVSGTARYSSTQAGFGSGTLAASRLTAPAGSVCLDNMPTVPANASWSQGADQPESASESAATKVGNFAYVGGGFGDPAGFKRYDLNANSWSTLAQLPGGRDHLLVLAVDGTVFVAGGNDNGTRVSGANGWRYVAAENRWVEVPELPRYVQAGSAALNGFGYFGSIVGGMMQYNPRTGATRQIAGDASVTARDHSQLVSFQGELWLLGGRSGTRTTGLVSIFDPASETWRPGPIMNSQRAGFAAAASATMIIVAGGEVITADPWRVVRDVEAIAAGETRWTEMPQLPLAVHGVPGVMHGDSFMALGGSTAAGVAANTPRTQILRW